MVAYNFQKQFADAVERGEKTQTIRAPRKNGHAKVGDNLQLYYGMRTKQCRKLLDTKCTRSVNITVKRDSVVVSGGDRITIKGNALFWFASDDGFDSWQHMRDWFDDKYGLPFSGVLISWE